MSITSGLAPIRYANGDLVEEPGMFDNFLQGVKKYSALSSPFNLAVSYARDPERTKQTMKDAHDFGKDYIFDYTDPYEWATLPLYAAGPFGAAANRGIKAARIANKASKGYKPSGIEKILGSKSFAWGVPTTAIVGPLAADEEFRDDVGTIARSVLGNDALDDAEEDLQVANENEQEDQEDQEEENKWSVIGKALSDLGALGETGEMSPGYMIEGTSINTPEIRRYESGGIANIIPIGMSEGGGIDFAKLGSALSGMGGDDAPKMTQGFSISSAKVNTPEIKQGNPEALRDANKDFDEFKTDVESNYVNFANGGIATMEPMMMAAGGIAKFGRGKEVIKKGTEWVRKRISKTERAKADAKKARAKAKEAETKAKKAESKAKKAKAKEKKAEPKVKKGPGRPKGSKNKPKDVDSFIPPGIAMFGRKATDLVKQIPTPKRQAGRALFYGAPAITGAVYGGKALFGDDEKKPPGTGSGAATIPEIEESDAMKDILYQNSLERATAAGRTEPSFMDYLASFPGSYTEKVGKDPEFAKQMMAGFMAMMKPTEGFVPRNSLVDFGEAAMAEGIRQQDAIPEQLQLIERLKDDPDLLKAFRLINQDAPDPLTDQTRIGALKEILLTSLYGEGNYDDDSRIMDTTTNQTLTDTQLLQLYKDAGGDYNLILPRLAAVA